MPDDESLDIEGYDGAVDDGPSIGGARGAGRPGIPSPGRRGGKKALAPASSARRRGRSMGGGFPRGFGINPRELAGSVNSLLAAAVIGVLAVAAILLYTFSAYKPGDDMQFYGALVAAMAVMLVLSYLAVKLLNIAD